MREDVHQPPPRHRDGETLALSFLRYQTMVLLNPTMGWGLLDTIQLSGLLAEERGVGLKRNKDCSGSNVLIPLQRIRLGSTERVLLVQ